MYKLEHFSLLSEEDDVEDDGDEIYLGAYSPSPSPSNFTIVSTRPPSF
jgi:hypothetical protein